MATVVTAFLEGIVAITPTLYRVREAFLIQGTLVPVVVLFVVKNDDNHDCRSRKKVQVNHDF